MENTRFQKLRGKIVATIIGFSVIPLRLLRGAICHEFSFSYHARVRESLRTLVENRRGVLDLFLDERVSQLLTLAHTHTLETLKDENYLNKVFRPCSPASASMRNWGSSMTPALTWPTWAPITLCSRG